MEGESGSPSRLLWLFKQDEAFLRINDNVMHREDHRNNGRKSIKLAGEVEIDFLSFFLNESLGLLTTLSPLPEYRFQS